MNDNPKLKKNGGQGTNVGNAIRFLVKQGKVIAPDILELAGSITGIKKLNTLGEAIRGDKNITPEDKQILLQEMENDMVEMVEITKRLQIDSEHAITRMIRPVSYAAMFVLFMFVMLLDGNLGTFTIDKAYVPVIQSLFGTMTIFYFGSRGAEKITRIIKNHNNNK